MPIHDAIFHSNHLIVTKFGGITEYLDNNSANIIKHDLVPVTNMSWSKYYNESQRWAEPSLKSLMFEMRKVYTEREDLEYKINNYKGILNKMSPDFITKKIESELSHKRFRQFIK